MTEIYKVILSALLFSTCSAYVNDTYYPRYHLAPCKGWMNDPNGFCKTEDGTWHLFYQYNPLSSQEPGIARWGHAYSKDLMHWLHLPIAMKPNETYDKSGVFSGSALIEDGVIYILYTGNQKYPDQTPDHQNRQALAVSTDGITFTKHSGNPILSYHQPDFRDPKVWKHDGTYYMVLGSSFNNATLGSILLYASDDKITWKQVSVLGESTGRLGYMWECPDLFPLGEDYYMLLFSPQGIKAEGDKFKNLYQTGYFIGTFDYSSHVFKPMTEFKEIDHGHDFYATQTTLEGGRRIMVGWFDMWEQDYPERDTGFTGCMTIPRELTLGPNLTVYQTPVSEISAAIGKQLFSGKGEPCDVVELEDKAAEIVIRASSEDNFALYIESDTQTVVLSYDYENGTVSLDRGGDDGVRRTEWRPQCELRWRVFVDASSVELFCGDGETTLSSRFFPLTSVKVKLGGNAHEFTVNAMKRTTALPSTCCEDC